MKQHASLSGVREGVGGEKRQSPAPEALARVVAQTDAGPWSGDVFLYTDQTPSLSCLGALAQLRARWPDVSVRVAFEGGPEEDVEAHRARSRKLTPLLLRDGVRPGQGETGEASGHSSRHSIPLRKGSGAESESEAAELPPATAEACASAELEAAICEVLRRQAGGNQPRVTPIAPPLRLQRDPPPQA